MKVYERRHRKGQSSRILVRQLAGEPRSPARRRDAAMRSPRSNIVAAMQADGVDMLDKAAVDAWIVAYNPVGRGTNGSDRRFRPGCHQ